MQDIHNASLRWEYRNLIHNKKEIDCEKPYTHVGLDDAEKELKKMQGLENARKEMGISDKDDKPLKFIMNCNNRDIVRDISKI